MRKPFRFFNFLADHDGFLPVVAKVWETSKPLYHSRAALSQFHRKLTLLKFDLRAFNRNHYGDIPKRTKDAFETFCTLQNHALLNPDLVSFAAASAASDRWQHLASVEEKFYRHKSRIKWLEAGIRTLLSSIVQLRVVRPGILSRS